MKLLLSHILIYLWKFGTGAFIDAGLVTVEETESWACQKMTRQSLSFVMLSFWKSLFSNLKANLWWFDSARKSLHTQLHLFWEFLLLRKTIPTKGVIHKVCTAKIIHSHLPSTVKKYTLNPKALLDVLIQNFLIALYSSFFYRIFILFWSCAAIVNIFYNKVNRRVFSFSVFTFISICLAFMFSVSRKVRVFSVSLCILQSTSNQFLFQNFVSMKT